MKHAGPDTLDELEPLLAEIRALALLTEKKRGTFYNKSIASLHFHEDATGIFADVKIDGDWQRYDVTKPAARKRLVGVMRKEFA
jgi:hypothetical protein